MKWDDKEMKWDGLMQRMTRGRCLCHCDHRTDNCQQKMRKEEAKQEETRVFQEINTDSFFTYKNTTGNMRRVFVVKWSTEVCFVFIKSTTNCESKAETSTAESTQRKFFFATERRYCVLQSVQKEESVSSHWKWTIERKILSKSRNFRKDVTKEK